MPHPHASMTFETFTGTALTPLGTDAADTRAAAIAAIQAWNRIAVGLNFPPPAAEAGSAA
ncbi:hypothetical protein D9M68_641800 [compost metagenome]